MKIFYTVKEVAKLLGFSTNTVYKYLDEKKIKAIRLGSEGRFRIPNEEVERLLQEDKFSKNPSPEIVFKAPLAIKSVVLGKYKTPGIFDWFVAFLAMGIAFAQFIFPNYFIDPVFVKYLPFIKIIKICLFVSGGMLIFSDLLGAERRLLHKGLHYLLALLFIFLGMIYLLTGHLPQFASYISIALVMIISGFLKYNEYTKFLIFVNVLIFIGGISFLINPSSFITNALSLIYLQNKIIFILFWLLIFAFSLILSIKSIKKGGNFSFFYSFAISLLALIYSGFAFSFGYWESAVSSVILGAFSLIFPYWKKFEEFTQKSKKEFLGSFIWLASLFFIGSIVLIFIYQSFEHYLLSEVQNRLETAISITNSFMDGNQEKISVFAGNNELISLLKEGNSNSDDYEKVLKDFYFASVGTLRRVVLVNNEGIIVSTYPYLDESINLDISEIDYFKITKEEERPYISGIEKPKSPNVPPSVMIASPIMDENNNFWGVLMGSADLENLAVKINEIKFGEGGEFMVADSKGEYIINPQKELVMTPIKEGDVLAAAAVDGEEGQIKAYDMQGRLSLIAYKKIDNFNWGISAQQPFSGVFRNYSIAGFVIFLVLITTGVGSLVFIIRSKKNKL